MGILDEEHARDGDGGVPGGKGAVRGEEVNVLLKCVNLCTKNMENFFATNCSQQNSIVISERRAKLVKMLIDEKYTQKVCYMHIFSY